MTLAALLLNGFLFLLPLLLAGVQTQASRQSSEKPASDSPAQDQAQPQQTQQQPPESPSTTAPAPKHSTAKQPASKPQHKKTKVMPIDCNATPANGSPSAPANGSPSAPSDSPPSDKTPADKAANPSAGETPQKTATPAPPSNCPPSKVIVKQGGTSEPSIQLAGGSGGAPDQATANQMLQSAEDNLKKITAQQLTSNQQDMVTQVRKFMDQSKTATAAGDLERARTLAWKAQTLSEELASPEH